MIRTISICNLVMLIFAFCFSQCKKDPAQLNITLNDKSLKTIKSHIQGRWRLQYTKGGICGSCVYPAKNNQYMDIAGDRIIVGSDSAGVIIDTTITWIQATSYYYQKPTYLLSYYFPPGYGPFPISYIVDGIYNDTLRLIDNASDPSFKYLTKY